MAVTNRGHHEVTVMTSKVGEVGRMLLERRLKTLGDRMKVAKRELVIAEEQLSHFAEVAEEARLRALVSETPLAEAEHREAERHAQVMRGHRDGLSLEVQDLEKTQDDLLDRLLAVQS